MKVTLSLTHRCNLSCRYCYAGQPAAKEDMTIGTAKSALDFAYNNIREAEVLDICLFGGEPLLRFDLVREITSYSLLKTAEKGTKTRISITTNGTLVTPEVVDFAADCGINLCFSIDGPSHVHDRFRPYPDGRGTLQDILPNLDLALKSLGSVEVNAVFGPQTLPDLPSTLRFLLEKGVTAVHFNPDITAQWPENLYPRFKEVYLEVARQYVESYRQGREIAVNLIDSKAILFIKGGYSTGDKCGMGIHEWAFAPSGNVYPCERFIGDDANSPFCLGSVSGEIQRVHCCALRLKKGNRNPLCARCAFAEYCMNWCGCTNYFMSGHTDLPTATLCAMERAAIHAADHAFKALVESGNDAFLDHMFRYSCCDASASLARSPHGKEATNE